MLTGVTARDLEVGANVRIGTGVRISGTSGTASRVVLADGATIGDGVVIEADEVLIGSGTIVEERTTIRAQDDGRIELGDRVFVGGDTTILCGGVFVGDYTSLHNHLFSNGPGLLHVGHNCWVGGHCILDGQGGILVGDNVGIGAQSQLWSHIQFGDVLAGCRFHSKEQLVVENDVWFVGHCIVSPIRARHRSMAMVGSVVTRDMDENRVYAGVPAKDVTEKFGPQFGAPSLDERSNRMKGYLEQFFALHPEHEPGQLVGVTEWDSRLPEDVTQFHVVERRYTKHSTTAEMDFLAWVTPTLAKFVPTGWQCPSGDTPE